MVCCQGAYYYLKPGSQLKALHGNMVTPKHIAAFNDLSRILTATTRPKRGRRVVDLSLEDRHLTHEHIIKLMDGTTPSILLPEAPEQELHQSPRSQDAECKVMPDLQRLLSMAQKQTGKRAACPQAGPGQAPARRQRKASTAPVRNAATRPRTRSQAQRPQPTGVHPVAALLVSMRTRHKDQAPKPHLTSLQAYRKNIKATSTNPKEIIAALDDDLKIEAILNERTGPKGALLYKVRWQSALLLKRHAPLLESEGHGGTYYKVYPKLYGPRVSALYWHVEWHDTWEPEEPMHNQPESATLFEAYMPMAALKQARMEMRSDLQLTNLQKQGHGHKAPNQSDLSLSRQPELAAQICINTTSTVDPDRDLEGT